MPVAVVSAPTAGQRVYEARMEAVWGTDWTLAKPDYSDLSDPDRASWEDTARLIATREPQPAREPDEWKQELIAKVRALRKTVAERDAEIARLRSQCDDYPELAADRDRLLSLLDEGGTLAASATEDEERDREELDDDTDNTIPDTEGGYW